MSEKALRDLNIQPISDKNSEFSSKGVLEKSPVEAENENVKEMNHAKPASLVSSVPSKDAKTLDPGAANGNVEIEYIESENLHQLEDVDAILSTLLARLDSKDWVLVCEALNHVRQLALFHKGTIADMLGDVISLIVKSLKNPRSAVCKTAIMAAADIFEVYRDQTIDSFEPLLVQLLLKSSQDKRFVCDAAERTLITMTTCLSPTVLLPKLQPYLQHKNPRIRAKTLACISRSVPRLGTEGVKAYGFDELINVAASKLSDQLPESREAARVLTLELQTVYEKSQLSCQKLEAEHPAVDTWEQFCQSTLPPLRAQAVLRVTSTTREGVALEC
ncbi:unnamed protein product [Victoria cruziana]